MMDTISLMNENKNALIDFIYGYSKELGWKKSDIKALSIEDLNLLAILINKKEI